MSDDLEELVARAIHAANRDPEIYAWFHSDADKCRKSRGLARAAIAALRAHQEGSNHAQG